MPVFRIARDFTRRHLHIASPYLPCYIYHVDPDVIPGASGNHCNEIPLFTDYPIQMEMAVLLSVQPVAWYSYANVIFLWCVVCRWLFVSLV